MISIVQTSSISLTKSVAILIDADNVNLNYLDQVIRLSEYYGRINICYAFGDWKSALLSPWDKKLAPLVNYVQVDRVGKNATDHHLLVEIGEIIGDTQNNIQVFVIVSGDGDLASACRLIQARERDVIIMGHKEKMSKAFPEVCNTIFYLEELIDELNAREQHQPLPPNQVREFWEVLWRVCVNLYKTHDDWITLSEFEIKLREFEPDYEKKFGKYPLRQWLNNFDWYVEFDGERLRRNPKNIRYTLLVIAYDKTKNRFNAVVLHQLGKVLRELSSDYKSLFGNRKLSSWLKDYPDTFTLSEDSVILLQSEFNYIGSYSDMMKYNSFVLW